MTIRRIVRITSMAPVEPFDRLGYRYNPKYFADDPDHLFLRRDTAGRRTEHLHIFHPRSPETSVQPHLP